jgi:hypothetical protein
VLKFKKRYCGDVFWHSVYTKFQANLLIDPIVGDTQTHTYNMMISDVYIFISQ